MDAVNFFRSKWSPIRANAAMFIGTAIPGPWRGGLDLPEQWLRELSSRFGGCPGFLLSQLPKDARRQVNVDHVCSALTVLIRDEDATVRAKCAEAMGMLYDY